VKTLPVPAGSRKLSAFSLHGGDVKGGRAVWARELRYLDAHVNSSAGSWGALITTNKENAKRAAISDDPGAPNASVHMDIDVDKRGESPRAVTPEEVARLKKLVTDWVKELQDDVAVIVDDEDADVGGGGGPDGRGSMGIQMRRVRGVGVVRMRMWGPAGGVGTLVPDMVVTRAAVAVVVALSKRRVGQVMTHRAGRKPHWTLCLDPRSPGTRCLPRRPKRCLCGRRSVG